MPRGARRYRQPQAVAIVVANFFTVTLGASAAVALTSYSVAYAITALAISYALGKITTALTGSGRQNTQPAPQQFTARGAAYPRSMVYGATRITGLVVQEATSGDRNQYLWYVLAVAGHQLDQMTDIWFDGDQIPSSTIDSGTGMVTSGKYANAANIWKYTGTSAQTVDPNLNAAFAYWDTNHRGRGVAYIVIKLQQNSTLYPSGGPSNFYVTVQGRRLYDPRLDSTNGGSGSQRLNDATTWTFSNNPALAAADYITGGSIVYDSATPINTLGMQESSSRIDWSLVANAANICDQTPSIPGSTTQKRYLLAGVLSCGDTHSSNLTKITSTMVGQVIYRGGMYRIYAGAYDTPTITVTDDDLIGNGYEILAPGEANLYNAVSPIYVDPARNWAQVNSAINTNSTYATADGGQIVKSIDLTLVDDEYRAQRIGALILAQSRNLINVTLYLGINGFKISSWNTIMVALTEPGWLNKVFRVTAWQLSPDTPGVTITAVEESASAYPDPLASSYAAPGAATPGASTSDIPSQTTALTASPIADAIIFTWALPAYFPGGATFRLYRYTASSPFSSATLIWEGSSTHVSIPITDSTNPTLYYWLTSFYKGGESDPTPDSSHGVPAAALSVTTTGTGIPSFRASFPAGIYKAGRGASQVTPTNTVGVTGGTAPYAYAWTYVAGDTSISISGSTLATVYFSRASMANDTDYEATWQCVVTDSASHSFTLTTNITFERDEGAGL